MLLKLSVVFWAPLVSMEFVLCSQMWRREISSERIRGWEILLPKRIWFLLLTVVLFQISNPCIKRCFETCHILHFPTSDYLLNTIIKKRTIRVNRMEWSNTNPTWWDDPNNFPVIWNANGLAKRKNKNPERIEYLTWSTVGAIYILEKIFTRYSCKKYSTRQ